MAMWLDFRRPWDGARRCPRTLQRPGPRRRPAEAVLGGEWTSLNIGNGAFLDFDGLLEIISNRHAGNAMRPEKPPLQMSKANFTEMGADRGVEMATGSSAC